MEQVCVGSASSSSYSHPCRKNNVCDGTNYECKYSAGVTETRPRGLIPVADYRKYFNSNFPEPASQNNYQTPSPYSGNNNYMSAQTYSVVVNPVTNLMSSSGNPHGILFHMTRRNKTITAQWEPFSCSIGLNGIKYVTINNTFQNPPISEVSYPVFLKYNNKGRIGLFSIHLNSPEMYRIYFDHNDEIVSNVYDSLHVSGGVVNWIVKQ